MDAIQNTVSIAGASTVQQVVPHSNVTTNAVPGVAQVVGTQVPAISHVWYDGVSQIVAANPPAIQEIGGGEIPRQFNQHLQTPYGNIQVQVQQVTDPVIANKQHVPMGEIITTDPPKPKSRSRQSGSERVPCPTCGKTVSCNATLRDHMRTHTGERPFVCGECGLAFAQRSNLRMHKRLHTGERPYMCGICGKTFARSSHLPAHMRTHTGEKPYVCNACDHAFITAQQLKNHFRVHTGEKPWKCDLCDAAFTHSSSLSTHKKKHTGQKPFVCDKCQKSFFFISALDKHMKVHSKARPFSCTECDKSFKYKESLTVHLERYCGKESLRRPRAPRKPDARRPGPKPGSGRKYVQKRKTRPRGRPRKRGRWSQRLKTRRNYQDMDDLPDLDMELFEEDENSAVKGTKTTHQIKIENTTATGEDDFIDEEEDEIEDDAEQEETIPTAELKVEVITPDDVDPIQLTESLEPDAPTQPVEHSHLNSSVVQVPSNNEIHIDENTALTIVSAEEAEQHVAAGGVQLLTLAPGVPLQLVQQEGEDGQITHQLIPREGLQMWCQRQFQ